MCGQPAKSLRGNHARRCTVEQREVDSFGRIFDSKSIALCMGLPIEFVTILPRGNTSAVTLLYALECRDMVPLDWHHSRKARAPWRRAWPALLCLAQWLIFY